MLKKNMVLGLNIFNATFKLEQIGQVSIHMGESFQD